MVTRIKLNMKNVWGYYVYFPKEQLEDYLKLDFQEYLNIYYSETPEHWFVLKNYADIAFAADTDEQKAEVLKNDIFMTDFDYSLMHEKYTLLSTMSLPFDDDILRWIAFLYGYNRYFECIGNPSLEVWLNSKNFNHPFDEPPNENYFNNMGLLELATKFEYGQNACRQMLSSPIKRLFPM